MSWATTRDELTAAIAHVESCELPGAAEVAAHLREMFPQVDLDVEMEAIGDGLPELPGDAEFREARDAELARYREECRIGKRRPRPGGYGTSERGGDRGQMNRSDAAGTRMPGKVAQRR